jgi:murein DD-endopeptidase MepM/ murein hydrolase activator NlpD
MKPLLYFLIAFLAGCSVSKDPQRKEVRLLQKGKSNDDTSYVYQLPFEKGKAHLIVQGYFGRFSHKNRIAVDIKMKKSTNVCAAREGVVVRVVDNNTRGGSNKKNRPFANLIVVQHADNTRAGYWHLKQNGALVKIGDTVKRGQVIGLSGRTGYSAFPHLHFLAWRFNAKGQWEQMPTRFLTWKGKKYLRPFHWYQSKQG